MKEKSIKEFVIEIYSLLIEENIDSWLKSEEAIVRSKLNPQEFLSLKIKIKSLSAEIAGEFADAVIKEGFPEKEISPQKEKKILNEIMSKYMEKIKNESTN